MTSRRGRLPVGVVVEEAASRVTQQVLITDSLGQQWIAEFQLERQAPGDWLVEDCILESAPGQQAYANGSLSLIS